MVNRNGQCLCGQPSSFSERSSPNARRMPIGTRGGVLVNMYSRGQNMSYARFCRIIPLTIWMSLPAYATEGCRFFHNPPVDPGRVTFGSCHFSRYVRRAGGSGVHLGGHGGGG